MTRRAEPVTHWTRSAGRLLVLAAIVLAWQLAAVVGMLNQRLLPAPLQIAHAFTEWAASGTLVDDLVSSLLRVLVGFVLAATLATTLGIALAVSSLFQRQLTTIVEILRPIPPIAWIPLAILWFGTGNNAAFFIVALGAFFPILTSVYLGITSVRLVHVNTARCLGLQRRLMLTDVMLPSALPTVLVGLRTGLGVGWMSLIAAELVGAQSGLGYTIQLNRVMLNTDRVIAGMLVIGLVGLAMNRALLQLERRLTPWHQGILRTQ